MKISFASFLVITLVLCFSFLQSSMAAPAYPPPVDCGSKCGKRCSLAGNQKRCLKYCGICCQKCNCVPTGTYGNKSQCACYNNWLNSKGGPKCP